MLKHLTVSLVFLINTLVVTQISHADEEALVPAKLSVNRAEEASKTRQLKFHVRLDKSQFGKLK